MRQSPSSRPLKANQNAAQHERDERLATFLAAALGRTAGPLPPEAAEQLPMVQLTPHGEFCSADEGPSAEAVDDVVPQPTPGRGRRGCFRGSGGGRLAR